MDQIRSLIDQLRMSFDRLSGREKVMVMGLFITVILFVFILVAILANSSLSSQEKRLTSRKASLQQILELKGRFSGAQEDIDQFKKDIVGRKDRLTGDLGTLAQELGIDITQVVESKGAVDKQSHIREKSYKVELKKTTLVPLLQLLERMEKKDKLYFVRSLKFKRRFDDVSLLDATFRLSTLLPLNEEG